MNLIDMGMRAQSAARVLAVSSAEARNAALTACARALLDHQNEILAQNALDLATGTDSGLSPAMLDRLALTEARIDESVHRILTVKANYNLLTE